MKKTCLGSYKGVDLNKVLAIPLYASVASNIFKIIFHSSTLDSSGVESKVLVVYAHARSNRKDYLQIVTNLLKYIRRCSPSYIAVSSKPSLSEKLAIIRHLPQSVKSVRELKESIWYRCYLALMISRVRANIDEAYVFLNKSNIKVLVSFCDAYYADNILAQCANNLGKITVTLQHGQYAIMGHDCPENLALKNLVSDYLCAWGEATCDEFSKVGNKKTRVIPLGTLRSYKGRYAEYTQESLSEAESKGMLCLMLNADNLVSQNKKMIRIMNDFCDTNNMKYVVRFHPKNKKSYYINLFGVSYLGLFDGDESRIAFSVAYTSGVIVESLVRGELFFLYQDDLSPEVFKKEVIAFSSSEELKEKVSGAYRNKRVVVNELNNVRDFFIETRNVKERYGSFFLNLLGGKGC